MLISHAHRRRYRQYYRQRGIPSVQTPHAWQPIVDQLVFAQREESLTPRWTILDYGCGPQAALSRFAAYPVANYDPGTDAYAVPPHPADLVVCWHVLEHVEPDCLGAVLAHIKRVAREGILVAVSCQPSTKVLPDGTPWHTIVQPPDWWAETLQQAWGSDPERPLFPPVPREYRALFPPVPREYRALFYVGRLRHD